MKRSIIAGAAILAALAAASGGIAAQQYLIVSPHQIKPGAIGYRNLSGRTRQLIARHAGPRGRPGPPGASAANALARASGLVAWTSDPALISAGVADSSGSIHGGSVWLNRGDTIRWLAELVIAHGTGTTHGGYAIYDSRLHLVAHTPDEAAAFDKTRAPTWLKLPLTRPYRVPASGRYYLVELVAGLIRPSIGIVRNSPFLTAANALPTGVLRGMRAGSGLSAFPSRLASTTTGETRCILAG